MSFVIGTAIALYFLEGIWRVLLIAGVALVEVIEISIWLRWRKVGATTGAEGLVGIKGTAISDLTPEGQVKVKGQLWKAYCASGAKVGDEIVVEGVDGLMLMVSRGIPTQ